MKKKLLLALTALAVTIPALQASASTPEAYCVRIVGDSTLTFYYDTLRSTREGRGFLYEVPENSSPIYRPQWATTGYENVKMVKQVVFDDSFADFTPKSTSCWFFNLEMLESVQGIQHLNTTGVTSMARMFIGCKGLKTIDLSQFNTDNVTDMSMMFSSCAALEELDLSSFNTAAVTNMSMMFSSCTALKGINLSSFNTASATDMSYMFSACEALSTLDVTNFSVDNVTDMRYMFSRCSQLTTIYCNDDWKRGAEKNDWRMFNACEQLKGAKAFDAGNLGIDMANPDTGYFTRKEATAINEVTTTQAQGAQTRTYNLNGQLVGDGYKGIVIKNGKKVLQH